MTEQPAQIPASLSTEEAQELIRSLLHKEGNWVDWGKKCQQLQQAGYSAKDIFEATGFQGSQQNLAIVAAQVYESLIKSQASQDLLNYFSGPRSDVLHEFRILKQEQRLAAAQLAMSKKLDVDGAHEAARAIQHFSRLSQLPEGFADHPGDALAYKYWRAARGKKDLSARSRLIAQGLKFVHSPSAREKIEQLLTDFTVVPKRQAPLLPLYRLESEAELPRIIPVAGSFPLKRQQLEQIPAIEAIEPFRLVEFSGSGTFVPIPGWQVVLKAEDPVAIMSQSDTLPKPIPGKTEQVVVVVDRKALDWDVNSYFLIAQGENLELQWSEEKPEAPIIGKVVLVLRPKRILDENVITEPWQMDD